MSFVPQMNEYFGKDTSFTKMSNAYNASNRINIMSDIKGDLIRDQALKRAEMRRAQGKNALQAGQSAGSSAAWGDICRAPASNHLARPAVRPVTTVLHTV